MIHTRFVSRTHHPTPCPSPHGPRGRFEIRDPPPPSLFTHTARYSTIPRGIPSVAAHDDARTNASSGDRLDRDSLDRERARTRERPSAGTRPRERRRSIAAHSFAFAFVRATWTRRGHGAMLPVVLLPRGWHAEAEAEDVGDRFVVHAGARTRARARARGEVVLFHPDARDR